MLDMHEWTEGDVDSNGVNIHFYRTGQGGKPPLLLAHGLTDNGLCWARVASALQSSFDVVMVDARNHGLSDRAPAGLKELASDMAAVISQLGLGTAAVMGHSVGASIAASLAAHYPSAGLSCRSGRSSLEAPTAETEYRTGQATTGRISQPRQIASDAQARRDHRKRQATLSHLAR